MQVMSLQYLQLIIKGSPYVAYHFNVKQGGKIEKVLVAVK
jgi:hypothetical protein